jgi:ABC-type amino acid transport substrate-binding protein
MCFAIRASPKHPRQHGDEDVSMWTHRQARVFTLLIACCTVFGASAQDFIYPRSESESDSQYAYDYQLLRLALERTRTTHGPYTLRPSADAMNQARAEHEIVGGSGSVTIFARSTARDYEERMRPVRVPIDKGLVSYRIFLIRGDSQVRLDAVNTLDDLRGLRVGSFVTWADTRILREGGFNVVTGDSYEGLFRMLLAGRFELFSRSVDEAYREYDERRALLPGLAVDDKLLLYFPTTRYFFVQRSEHGERLATRVQAGLEAMIQDGSFDTYFNERKGPLIARAHLKDRKLFRIGNPFLTPQTPLARKELWYDPLGKP